MSFHGGGGMRNEIHCNSLAIYPKKYIIIIKKKVIKKEDIEN